MISDRRRLRCTSAPTAFGRAHNAPRAARVALACVSLACAGLACAVLACAVLACALLACALLACARREPAAPANAADAGIAIAVYDVPDGAGYAVVDDRRWVDIDSEILVLDHVDPRAALPSLVIEAVDARPSALDVGACARDRIPSLASPAAITERARDATSPSALSASSATSVSNASGASGASSASGAPSALGASSATSASNASGASSASGAPSATGASSATSASNASGASSASGAPSASGVSSAADGANARTPTFVPILRCAVHGARGRRLVRILYVVPGLAYRTSHHVAMTGPDRATVTSRFSIATPAWQRRAELALYDGVPGAQQPPREIARGAVVLDGGIAVLASAPQVVTAQLRRIYDGAVHRRGEVGPRDPRWRRESHAAVWVWLELDRVALASGPVHAHIELAGQPTRDIDVPALGRRTVAGALGLPLWIDDELRGRRDRWSQPRGSAAIVDRFAVSIANLGPSVRDVWIEESLRPARRRTLRHAWPSTPVVLEGYARLKLSVAPGKAERCGFEIDYELQGPRER